ncbi:hypothetical protein BGZ52_006503 [Haplosporangium bisporale]|nr:hypothetical protein BGZ52_006503 [Haplosporangium bisporale]KAI9238344.1 MAG: hypothetical protein BYD32DRAFT_480411 [Podila humilis]KFH69693.1 hypothetical protein MVEG_04499 [Podila verticillata NRRL 6337]
MITPIDEKSSSTPGSTPLPYSAQTGPSSPNATPIELNYITLPVSSSSYPSPVPAQDHPQYTPSPSTGQPTSPSFDQQQQHPYQPVLSSVTVVDAAAMAVDSSYTDKFQPKEVELRYVQHIFNPKKKTFWAFWIIVLAIIFGVLGGTVWKPKSEEESSSPAPNNNSSNGGKPGSPEWAACAQGCSATKSQCENSCRSSDSVFQTCSSKCTKDMPHCDFDCRMASPCFNKCSDDWGNCAPACSK